MSTEDFVNLVNDKLIKSIKETNNTVLTIPMISDAFASVFDDLKINKNITKEDKTIMGSHIIKNNYKFSKFVSGNTFNDIIHNIIADMYHSNNNS